ncbi:MAG: hypothetical protein WC960_00115 [Bacteroidales bacterium]
MLRRGAKRARCSALLPILILVILSLTACRESRREIGRYHFEQSYIVTDTTEYYNLYLFVRLLSKESGAPLPILLTVVTPGGVKYCDTLQLPFIEKGVGAKSIASGIWKDWLWPYRRDVKFSEEGEWNFTISLNSFYPLPKRGAAVIVEKRDYGKK